MRFDCSERRCPSDCSGGYTPLAGGPTNRSALGARGLCVDGSCVCLQGWTGADCSKPTCPAHEGSLCGGHGVCDVVRGACHCEEGWAGPDCAQCACSNRPCRNGGKCIDERCYCPAGFSGEDCSLELCVNGCSGNGACRLGRCVCHSGWGGGLLAARTAASAVHVSLAPPPGPQPPACPPCAGDDCSEPSCMRAADGALCHGRGECVIDPTRQVNPGRMYACLCDEGWIGDGCESAACPDGCTGRGACVDGRCLCEDGWSGKNCATRECLRGCSGRETMSFFWTEF